MARETRPVIAINEATGERKEFGSVYAAAKEMKVSHTHVLIALALGACVKEWKVFDTPENIRRRIAELESVIKKLEE